jgi:hypothetical protein
MSKTRYKIMCALYNTLKLKCKCGEFKGHWGYQHLISGCCETKNPRYGRFKKTKNFINKVKGKILDLFHIPYVKIIRHDNQGYENYGFYQTNANGREFRKFFLEEPNLQKTGFRYTTYASSEMYRGIDVNKAIKSVKSRYKTIFLDYLS